MGDARVRCERVSEWQKFSGYRLYETLGPLRDLSDLANLYCTYCPHRLGLADALSLLAPAIGEPSLVRHLEESLLGYEWGYSVELTDSPSLPSNLALLSRVPELWDLAIESEHYGYPLLHALTKVNVLHELALCGENQAVATKDGWLRQQWCLHHDVPGRPTLTLDTTAQVYVDDAESALPALKATANLKQVLLTVKDEEGAKQMTKAQEILEKALPNVKIYTFMLSPQETADSRESAEPAYELRDLGRELSYASGSTARRSENRTSYPVAAGAEHSRLLVGHRDDPKRPCGGMFFTKDSGTGKCEEVTYHFVKTKVGDVFWVEALVKPR